MKFNEYLIPRYHEIQKQYIEHFFYGDEFLWKGKTEPFVELKALFRQHIDEYLIPTHTKQAELEGAHPTTISNSLKKETFKLHPKLQESAEIFLLERLGTDPQTYIKIKLQNAKTKGYTNEDCARNYGVHERVIDKIMTNQPVAPNTIEYLYQQICTAENRE